MSNNRWVHFIGIAGVATGQLAVEFKNNGWIVTGSDKGLFPPMSDYIVENDINIQIGFKKEHLTKGYYINKYNQIFDSQNNNPDLIISQGTKGDKNEEYVYANELNIPVKSYPEILAENVIVSNSIVVAGTYGKSTITSMLVEIFRNSNIDISYMFGALSNNGINGVKFKTDKTEYSIVEGDEYIESIDKPISKFFRYKPKYLILTSAKWDHSDVFKTKEHYLNNYKELIDKLPEDGLLVVDGLDRDLDSIIKDCKCNIINLADYAHFISNSGGLMPREFELNVIGDFNQKNALFAFSLASKIGLDEDTIVEGLKNYNGIKRRLEIRFKSEKLMIIDDFGSSAPKARSSIETLKKAFPGYKIISIFEPNIGSRTRQGLEEYKDVFKEVDKLYLPRFTTVSGDFLSANNLGEYLVSNEVNCSVELNDEKLINLLYNESKNSDRVVLVFLGSHGFRGMISSIVCKVENG